MLKHFDGFMDNLNCSIYLLLIIVGILQVFFRYVLNYSLSWTEEIGRYSFVWLTFVGAALCVRKNSHIGLDIFTNGLSKRNQFFLQIFVYIVTMGFLLFLIYQGLLITQKTTRQVSAALHIPMAVFYFSIPLGAFLMFINTLRNFTNHMKSYANLEKSS